MSLEHSPERDDGKKKSTNIATTLVPSIDPLGPSLTIAQFCVVESIAKPTYYNLEDKPGGYYIGDAYRIPPCEHAAWRERRIAAAPEIAARQSEAVRNRVATRKNPAPPESTPAAPVVPPPATSAPSSPASSKPRRRALATADQGA